MKLSPIIVFVYNRPEHTKRTIEALKKNVLAEQSDIIIFSDAARTCDADLHVQKVRQYLKTITGFNSIRIIERQENWGLAKSIIEGVTEVINTYGKVIVLEDDIVTSPAFLTFMNKALDFYERESKVWHISGWSYPINTENLGDAFLWRVMNCWGWATWSDRWKHYEKTPQKLITDWTTEEKYRFDLDSSGIFWNQVEANAKGTMNTWAIFWYATIFQNHGLCLNPSISFVENIGLDGSGTHCTNEGGDVINILNYQKTIKFPIHIYESVDAVSSIKKLFKEQKQSALKRVINKISRKVFAKNLL